MSVVKIAALIPTVHRLSEGEKYYWCSCGRSKNQPFCDGSHEGTTFEPMEFTVNKTKNYGLCQCKHTKTPPLCDGSHKEFSE